MLSVAGDRYRVPLTAFFLPQESFFNLRINLVQPLFGTISAILIRRDLGFQFRYTALRRAQLMRKLLSHIESVAAVLFSYSSCLVKQLEYRLSGSVELVGAGLTAAAVRR